MDWGTPDAVGRDPEVSEAIAYLGGVSGGRNPAMLSSSPFDGDPGLF